VDNLKSTAGIVRHILEEQPKTRNSDSLLYLKVLEHVATHNEECPDLKRMTVPDFLLNMSEYGFPPFESVRRNRQLVQAKRPDLAASNDIDAWRTVNEERVLEYVRGAKYET